MARFGAVERWRGGAEEGQRPTLRSIIIITLCARPLGSLSSRFSCRLSCAMSLFSICLIYQWANATGGGKVEGYKLLCLFKTIPNRT